MVKTITIKYYAHLAIIANTYEEPIQIDSEITLDKLLTVIQKKQKNLAEIEISLVVLNGKFIPISLYGVTFIEDGDIVALYPPVSSG